MECENKQEVSYVNADNCFDLCTKIQLEIDKMWDKGYLLSNTQIICKDNDPRKECCAVLFFSAN